ncbi:O-methyltransferase [Dermacoccus nishinomiyaensis]|uniref:O-methyltransferase n=1 Tax=Dermacoccus nishinomiyaensis TaxID=1274 RepID=UPI000E015D67|nr:O-methyltransferase [Dermacoccus nishinomiyaensis]QQY25580.1 O-methyltransferase [Dermacoccus nishinomiyaensis]STD17052.1 Putative O-methyltransferase MSMEG_5073 [Dermacoccus nishinomiyaensis]
MTSFKPASWAYAEDFADEPQHIEAARIQGEHLGATPVTSAAGAALRMLAASTAARTVVEIGTGAGSSGLWLLDGMPADGVLTTIDISMEHQRAARAAYQRAGYPPQRTRIISGSALTVLPRLADAAYDLVLVDGEKDEYPAYVEQALRLVRRGGVIVLDNMLWHDRVADPAVRDETTKRLRALGKALRERDDLLTTLLPVGDGLLVCVKR